MTDTPRSLNCPNCGAPISFPPGEDSLRCRFCDSSIERSPSDLTADDDAHVIQLNTATFSSASVSGPARRFVLKMRNGQPVMIEVGQPPAQPPARPVDPDYARRVAAASDAAIGRRPRTAAPPAKSSSLGCVLVGLVIVAVIGVIATLMFLADPKAMLLVQQLLAGDVDQALATGGTLGANVLLSGSNLLIPGPDAGPDQAILLSNQYPAGGEKPNEYRLMAVDTATRRLLWQTEPLGPDLYSVRLLYDTDRIYLTSGASLVAVNRADGAIAWTAPLADAIEFNICTDCLQLVAGRLGALSADGTLAVYDAATGDQQWAAVADQASPRGLYLLGGRLAFMDRNAEAAGVLRAFDAVTGQEKMVTPSCTVSEDLDTNVDWTTPLWLAPDGDSLYLAFGYSTVWLQRWDAHSLQADWCVPLSDSLSVSADNLAPVFTPTALYLAAGHQVLAVDLAQGRETTLLADEDNEFSIVAVQDADLVVLARRTRGTTRYALWDVDPTSGDPRWTFDLGDNEPLGPGDIIDEDSPQWLAQPTAAGLRLVRFQSAEDDRSHAILNELLDWQTGASGGQTKTILNLPTIIFDGPNWQAWRGDTLWMVVENKLIAFDTAGNQIVSRWP